ncbi:hypothetical protein LJ707_07220 [Mucilaginibacter sp. UR6-1]|uniref:hypothetical protein n=1 Tax=Mucilaginibacter sp. UR6-1 TaxID=1435643 RepID=UPI001E523946|nr:hypothetical protein [Mucilaginibacter sp. UR6-1]MCC8408713.1 hypothetical protein [Mucilaginibacter sp. UR6-1]
MQTQLYNNDTQLKNTGIIINTILFTPGEDDDLEGDWDDEDDEEFDDLMGTGNDLHRIRQENDWDEIDEDDDDHLPDDDLQ